MQFQLIESFSTVGLEKKFPVKSFLNQFSVSNKGLTKIKKQLIELFSELKDSELIDDRICLDNDSDIDIKDLMPVMLSKNKYISFWEKVQGQFRSETVKNYPFFDFLTRKMDSF